MTVTVEHNAAKTQFDVDMLKFKAMTPNTQTVWLAVAIKHAIVMVNETAARQTPPVPQTNM